MNEGTHIPFYLVLICIAFSVTARQSVFRDWMEVASPFRPRWGVVIGWNLNRAWAMRTIWRAWAKKTLWATRSMRPIRHIRHMQLNMLVMRPLCPMKHITLNW